MAAHPAIAALVYFNADSTNNGISYNWRVDTAAASFEGFRYLFSGPAPVPPAEPVPSAAPDPAAPDPAAPEPLPATPADGSTAPKTSRPKGPALATDGSVADVTAAPAPTTAAGTTPGRAPSPRLTWVLQLLRQLDAASVAT